MERKDEKVQSFSFPLPQNSAISLWIDETAHSKPSEDCSGLFLFSMGFTAAKELKLQMPMSEDH